MNAPSDSSGKSTPPDLFDVVENIRTKAKSQIKTANMIGKFVTPVLRRKITAFVNEQLGALGAANLKPVPKPSPVSPGAATSPAAATTGPARSTPTSVSRKRPTGATATSRARSADAVADQRTSTKPSAAKSTAAKPTAAKSTAAKPTAAKSTAAKPTAAKSTAADTQSKAAAKAPSKPAVKPRSTQPAKSSTSPRKQSSRTTAKSTNSRLPIEDRALAENPLGIDGYDGLPSSAIVPLLDGLSQPQLRAVETYEQANRARRTVLHRAKQLQSS